MFPSRVATVALRLATAQAHESCARGEGIALTWVNLHQLILEAPEQDRAQQAA